MTEARADGAVVIGRFQPFHNGHLRLVHRAFEVGERCIVVLGSSQESRTERNPFTVDERQSMIEAAIDPEHRHRLRFVPIADVGDEPRWAREVERVVTRLMFDSAEETSICLVGAFKDPSSDYLRAFPRWPLIHVMPEAEADGVLSATDLRTVLFETGLFRQSSDPLLEEAWHRLAPFVPAGTLAYLREWRRCTQGQLNVT